MSKKIKKVVRKKTKKSFSGIYSSPMLIGALSMTPFFFVMLIFGFAVYKFVSKSPQEELIDISFDDNEAVAGVARTMLENDDTRLAKLIYSKMIDGMNIEQNGQMSSDFSDDMIIQLNPRLGLSEDIRTKTLMSESIKSKLLYKRLSKMFAQLGFTEKSREFENKANEVDPIEN